MPADESGCMICVRCGQQNPDNANFCASCNIPLPKISAWAATPLSPRISKHYNQLQEACQDIKSGKLTPEQFRELMEMLYSAIEQQAHEIESMEIPDYLLLKLQTQIDTGFSGIYDFLDGIQELHLYLEDGNEEHFEIGLQLAQRGNESLNQALDMARTHIQTLKESDPDDFNPIA